MGRDCRRQSKGGEGRPEAGLQGRRAAGRGREAGPAGAARARGLAGPSEGTRASASMGPAARLAALLAVLALRAGDPTGAAARGDTFSALTSVARALAPERRLLGLLRRYLRGEEARLRDLTR